MPEAQYGNEIQRTLGVSKGIFVQQEGRADHLLDCGQDSLPGLKPPVLGMEPRRVLP